MIADGTIAGDDIICGVHGWDYQYRTGVSSYAANETLHKFQAWIDLEADAVYVNEIEIAAWERENPQRYPRDTYLGLYEDLHGAPEEVHNTYIRILAREGLINKKRFYGKSKSFWI